MDPYRITARSWDKAAAAYEARFMDLDLYNDTYDAFYGLLEDGARVFEIGCGPGNIARYVLSRRPDLSWEGIDIAPAMIDLARVHNPAAAFRVMDGRDIGALTGPCAGILCGFIMPYLSGPDCAQLVSHCARLLQEEGIFYCSAIAGAEEQSGYENGSNSTDRMYVYYHSEEDMNRWLQAAGIAPVHLFRKAYPGKDGTTATHLVLIGRKGYAE